jgi:ubiquinone/menaquinone biosynthesis C-methylase UbiE
MSFNVQEGYNQWAHSYDSVENKTRDLDKKAVQNILSQYGFLNVLELGCGTGKNTEWLAAKAQQVTAVDFSEIMLQKAKEKITLSNVTFIQADVTRPWPFEKEYFDLVTCNLILEHVQDLKVVFAEASRILQTGGNFFICELHPFKQYSGSKARFEKDNAITELDCFVHHTAEFFNTALQNGFSCTRLDEWFDEDKNDIPRLISFVFEK